MGSVIADTVRERRCIFLASLWHSERMIARCLGKLAVGVPVRDARDVAAEIERTEGRLGIRLAQSQKDAVVMAVCSKRMVITGGPGVGKTTLVRAILAILGTGEMRVLLAAPTGRAARRFSESTGLPATILHRLLEVDGEHGGFKRGPDHPLEVDLLVIDECSMVDVPLMASVMKALPNQARLMLVGDVDQLPSVGPGQVLADIIASECVRVAHLSEIFRQAAESRIIASAHWVNGGYMPDLEGPKDGETDFYFVPANTPETAVAKMIEIVVRRVPRRFGFDAVEDVQVLCPMNRGGLGVRTLNVDLQAALNPRQEGDISVERFGNSFRVGDKVMQTENDYDKEVFNGDIGFVRSIDAEGEELVINFDDRNVIYEYGDLDELSLAYAVSIHKSQGSEYPVVVMPVMMHHYMMLQRNLLYTGITRGRKLIILVGERRAIGMAVRNRGAGRRWSKLTEWLTGEPAEDIAKVKERE